MNLIITNQTEQNIDMNDKLADVIKTVLETEGLSLAGLESLIKITSCLFLFESSGSLNALNPIP